MIEEVSLGRSVKEQPELSIIVVTYNSAHEIISCLESIYFHLKTVQFEIIIVDNKSADGTIKKITDIFDNVKCIENTINYGFPGGNNQGLSISKGKYILLLNPDTLFVDSEIENVIFEAIKSKTDGIMAPVLLNADQTTAPELYPPGIIFTLTSALRISKFFKRFFLNQIYFSGACLLFSRETFQKIGDLDTDLFWCEDIDYCFRARKAGFILRNIITWKVVHLGGKSAQTNIAHVTKKQYLSKLGLLRKHYTRAEGFSIAVILFIDIAVKHFIFMIFKFFKSSYFINEKSTAYSYLFFHFWRRNGAK
jgi:GT2 family glycosyltransferase